MCCVLSLSFHGKKHKKEGKGLLRLLLFLKAWYPPFLSFPLSSMHNPRTSFFGARMPPRPHDTPEHRVCRLVALLFPTMEGAWG